MWYRVLRPALFALDPERAHRLALNALRLAGPRGLRARGSRPVEWLQLRFPNRVGLAAGFDKNATAVDALGALGFGFIEIGTVTPRPQAGQPRPRLFRIGAAEALINRLGFPNDGVEKVVARLNRRTYRGVVGVNIGKNVSTPLERAIDDYVTCLRAVRRVADYVVVNVSSPNTPGLRSLQGRELLEPLLTALLQERGIVPSGGGRTPPLLLKISPDLADTELREIASLLRKLPLDGVVATNTTLNRETLGRVTGAQTGGISGRPLHSLSLRTVASLRELLGPAFQIIGAGGVTCGDAAVRMRQAGADLVQIYTGLIYRGPALVAHCVRALQAHDAQISKPPGG